MTLREITLLESIPVAALDLKQAAALISARDPALPFATVIPINAQLLVMANAPGSAIRPPMDQAWLRLNDSRILAALQRWATGETVPLAPGSDLCVEMLNRVIRPDDAVTVIGGGPQLAPVLQARFGLRRLAQHEPPMGYMNNPAARDAAIHFIESHPARYIFVATGAPRSEQLMAAVAARGLTRGVGMAVGSGLLFAAGLSKRAPAWMRRSGLEWLHRALSEPKRLGARYASDALPLLGLALRARHAHRARMASAS
ncbi:WecB/TagA/CpsF family glycosyltransferase [Falsiroseomonas tokyonensis]|uniref:WecB/TagA/CpsF family glycosyltransferase n=1 Tax=Falsiroseomonas tokyonensis TaxID=430521 RepID=A0ABV7BYN0_9PROT|nr:WecB/TagA/CpsF family glycosyltransferase [Falsiroseomonas tokyonensis]MBU8540741.1 WecB/TagA/CpsF family glycosyltransferase [Falsiroseomonas tokyonensis]